MPKVLKYIIIMAMAIAAPIVAGAQAFGIVRLPAEMCGADTLTFTFGANHHFNVVVNYQHSSLSHPGTVFLPDGEPCGSNGCSYRSPVTFTDFADGATITSAQNIKFVRLNIEHSFIGDLYIGITCPNGNKAVLMRFGGNNDSGCRDAIPDDAMNWLTGQNTFMSSYFGNPYDQENNNSRCDSAAPGNEPGVGWNYCWSNNTNSGFDYASGDGIVYREGHAHLGRIDSSNVTECLNFYHPDQNFNSLIGCPLNGSWYIEVVDGYSQDNGYIFDWELAIDESLLPMPCAVAEQIVDCPYAQIINDTTFSLAMPDVSSDSTIMVRLAIVNSCGDTVDTVVPILLHPVERSTESTSVCDVYSWNGVDYYSDTTITRRMKSMYLCDSLVATTVTILPSNHIEAADTVVENSLPMSFSGIVFTDDADTLLHYTNRHGCDSTIHYVLKVWHNVSQTFDTGVCSNQMPVTWYGVQFDHSDSTTLHLHTTHGADSTVRLNLTVLPIFDTAFADSTCSNVPYFVGNHLCDSTGLYEHLLTTTAGCDSMVHVDLTVLPSYDSVFFDTACAMAGHIFDGVHYTESGTYVNRYTTVDGCDSIRTLRLSLKDSDLKAIARITPRVVTPDRLTVRLQDMSTGAHSRVWDVCGVTNGEPRWQVEFPQEMDSMPVTLVAISSAGCSDTLNDIVYLDRATFFTPNVFTPDKETNNRWSPAMHDVEWLEVNIYDRQGRLICSFEGVDGYWDGTKGGVPCPQGAYVFVAKYSSRLYPNRVETRQGTITLLR